MTEIKAVMLGIAAEIAVLTVSPDHNLLAAFVVATLVYFGIPKP